MIKSQTDVFTPVRLHSAAPNGRRFCAYVIDSILMTLLATIAATLLNYFMKSSVLAGLFINIICATCYFVILPSKTGWTPGKKFMDLEIIDTHSQEKPSLGKFFYREFICKLTLVIGVFVILFDKDHEALHDKMAKTQVITYHSAEDGFSFLKIIGIGVTAVAAICAVFLYSLIYTAWPIKAYLSKYEVDGLRTEGISGNLRHGFTISSVSTARSDFNAQVKNISFKYDLFSFFKEGNQKYIKKISAEDIEFEILKKPNQEKISKSEAPTEKSNQNPKTTNTTNSKYDDSIFSLLIEDIDFKNFKIIDHTKKVYSFERLYFKGFLLDKNKDQIQAKLQSSVFISKLIELNIKEVVASFGSVSVSDFKIKVYKELFPEHLIGDIDVSGKLTLNFKSQEYEGLVTGFRNSVKLSADQKEKNIKLEAVNFQPHWYFKNSPPVHSLNLKVQSGASLLSVPDLNGEFFIRNRKFIFDQEEKNVQNGYLGQKRIQRQGGFMKATSESATYPVQVSFIPNLKSENLVYIMLEPMNQKPKVQNELVPQIPTLDADATRQPASVLTAETSPLPETTEDILAQMYYGRSMSLLNESESQSIKMDLPYIKSIFDLQKIQN